MVNSPCRHPRDFDVGRFFASGEAPDQVDRHAGAARGASGLFADPLARELLGRLPRALRGAHRLHPRSRRKLGTTDPISVFETLRTPQKAKHKANASEPATQEVWTR